MKNKRYFERKTSSLFLPRVTWTSIRILHPEQCKEIGTQEYDNKQLSIIMFFSVFSAAVKKMKSHKMKNYGNEQSCIFSFPSTHITIRENGRVYRNNDTQPALHSISSLSTAGESRRQMKYSKGNPASYFLSPVRYLKQEKGRDIGILK